MEESARFYRQPSVTSDLGRHRDRVVGLPAEPETLGAVVRSLLVHNHTAKVRGLRFSAGRRAHIETVGAEAIVDNVVGIDSAPLDRARPVGRRMYGFCYHFALLHCALLRAVGTAARVRCGFAGYFAKGRWIDHWVVEYWDGSRWVLTDSQTGRSDLTRDDFQDGVTAWKLCRAGAAQPAVYGNGELWGWDELRGSLINDVGALDKVEVAGWYWCDRLQVEPLDQPHEELDQVLDVVSVAEVGECFELYPDLRPPADAVAR
ncbi:transglutaminase-like domain-containing protein [Actinoplanes sp. Pm04-4]|uniref:Transglutaminase-like domain-containing protein n=1 Tax=Paractinoplanes pyxinae TaxID=2997416 RepID=A0ABT4AQU1_9ACTN|nr:transglutaminase-like domain-containing protein [Actinoplanes pyxinae]MCY1136609.1 transglutaminase-like domain-containing protein [Actinoplanes pyxinae]